MMKKKGSRIPLYRQVYENIRTDILSGVYLPGDLLLPIREQAMQLGVARNTVESAYQMLAEEGYVISRRRVGYRVLDIRNVFPGVDHPSVASAPAQTGESAVPLVCDFCCPGVSTELFPSKIWQTLTNLLQVQKNSGASVYFSEEELLSNICRHLKKHRGIECMPEQIFLCRNLTEAIAFIRFMHRPFLYTIPHHEGLLGNHLSEESAGRLLNKVCREKSWLLEDDQDGELVYHKAPYRPLYADDPKGSVIYTGTFDNLLGPLMKTQYILFPEQLLAEAKTAFYEMFRRQNNEIGESAAGSLRCHILNHSMLEQLALNVFLQSGEWERFLSKVRRRNAVRRDAVVEALQNCFGEKVTLHRTESGTTLVASFPIPCHIAAGHTENFARSFCAYAAANGLQVHARAAPLHETEEEKIYYSLCYTGEPEDRLLAGVKLMQDLFDAVRESPQLLRKES